MTPEEEIAALDKELHAKRIDLGLAEKWLAGANKRLERQRLIEASLLETLRYLINQPVISLTEYRSLRNGRSVSLAELEKLRMEMRTVNNARTKLLQDLEQLTRARERIRLTEPPRVVLEFRRDNQRST